LRDHRLLHLRRRHSTHGAFAVALTDGVGGDVVAVELAGFAGVRGRHRMAARSEQEPFQQRRRLHPAVVGAHHGVRGKDGMHLVPKGAIDDRGMLAGIGRAVVLDC
jgi:hypothetical protein